MEEDKILFSVTNQEDGTSVSCNAVTPQEIFQVALAFHTVMVSKPKFAAALAFIATMYRDNPEFEKILNDATVEIPDFNSILKNTK